MMSHQMERMAQEVATLRSVAESGRGAGGAMGGAGAGGWGALPRGMRPKEPTTFVGRVGGTSSKVETFVD